MSLNALATVSNFTGEFANANWTPGFQVFGCGSSNVSGFPTSITLTTANGCAAIGANYTHTNGGSGATRAGTASFTYSVTESQPHSYSANYGIAGGSLTTITTSTPASGSASITTLAGKQIQFGVSKSSGSGITTLVISGFSYSFAPDVPTGVSAVAVNAQATVSWTAPADIGDSTITGYTVTASPDGATCSTSGTNCVVPGLTNGTNYTFTVTATNAFGTSPASSASSPVTPTAQPAPAITAVSPSVGDLAGGTSITITGADFTGATNVMIGGAAATGVTVENATTITATTPAGSAGAKDVAVTTGSGTGTGAGLFTYTDLSDPADDPAIVSLVTAQAELSRQFIEASLLPIMDRMEQLRSSTGFTNESRSRFDLNLSSRNYGQLSNLLPKSAWLNDATDESLPEDYAIWAQGTVTEGSVDASSNSSGRDNDSYGITVGIDKLIDEKTLIGTSLFIGRNETHINDAGSGIDVDALSLSLYGSYSLSESTFMDGAIGLGRQEYKLMRAKDGDVLAGERTGDQVFASVALSKRAEIESLVVSPYLRGDFGYTWLSGYAESDSESALVYNKHEISLAIVSAGLKVERSVEIDAGKIRPYARIEYGTDISSTADASMYYASAPGTIYRISIDEDSSSFGRLGLGFDLLTHGGMTLGIDYERQQHGNSSHLNTFRIDGAYKASSSTTYRTRLASDFETKPTLAGEIQFTTSPGLLISTGSTLDLKSPLSQGLGVFAKLEVAFQ